MENYLIGRSIICCLLSKKYLDKNRKVNVKEIFCHIFWSSAFGKPSSESQGLLSEDDAILLGDRYNCFRKKLTAENIASLLKYLIVLTSCPWVSEDVKVPTSVFFFLTEKYRIK